MGAAAACDGVGDRDGGAESFCLLSAAGETLRDDARDDADDAAECGDLRSSPVVCGCERNCCEVC